VANEIISYLEMCQRENASLQRGMNFRLGGRDYSVILMSLRPNAPYADRVEDDGKTIIYEGHDNPRRQGQPDPKTVDQPEFTPSGGLTENGKFHKVAQDHMSGNCPPDIVRVYEKIKAGIWSYNGFFRLIDSWTEESEGRKVFKFKLELTSDGAPIPNNEIDTPNPGRVIPASVKIEVYKRDQGMCAKCGSTENLHFDHIVPYSKGGSSTTAENIQLLCGRHNLEKRDKVE